MEGSQNYQTKVSEIETADEDSCDPEDLSAVLTDARYLEHIDLFNLLTHPLPPPFPQYIGLQILEKLIQTRWKALPVDQQQGIRNFIVAATVEVSSDEQRMRREKTYLNKLNLVLVQVSG